MSQKGGSPSVSDSKVGGKQFDLTPKLLNNPKYYDTRVLPQSGQTFLNLGPNGSTDVTFQVPTNVWNPAKSRLQYTRTIADQGAGNYAWVPQDTLGEIYQVRVYAKNNQYLVDLRDMNLYMKVNRPRETKQAVFTGNAETDGLYKCDTPAVQNVLPIPALGQATAFTNFVEKKYLSVSPVGVGAAGTGAISQQVTIPLGAFVDTFLGLDKDFKSDDIIYITFSFQSNKAGWSTTSAADPYMNGVSAGLVSGTCAAAVNGAAAGAGQFCTYLSGIQLMVATESRKEIIAHFDEMIARGYSQVIPYVWAFNYNVPSAAGTLTRYFDGSHGQYIRKIIHCLLPAAEVGSAIFDHSNLPTGAGAGTFAQGGSKVSSFHTEVDNNRQQQFDFQAVVTPDDGQVNDWRDAARQLQGSVTQGRLQHYYNWSFVENWGLESPEGGMAPSESIGGLTLDKTAQRKWDFVVMSGPANTTFNHHNFAVASRTLTVAKGGQVEIR